MKNKGRRGEGGDGSDGAKRRIETGAGVTQDA